MNIVQTADHTQIAYQSLQTHLTNHQDLQLWLGPENDVMLPCNIVQLSQDNFTIQTQQTPDPPLQEGQTILVAAGNPNHQIRFQANVLGKINHTQQDHTYMISSPFDVEGLGQTSEIRLSFRFSTTNLNLNPLKITPKPPQPNDKQAPWKNDSPISKHPIQAEIQNASQGGIGVVVPIFVETILAKTTRIQANITLPNKQNYTLNARIAHYHFNPKQHNYYLGLEIQQNTQGKDFLKQIYHLHKMPL